MYEQVSHSLLNQILDEIKPEISKRNLLRFYTRLGANFYAIHSLFTHLYGGREDFLQQMVRLVEVLATRYIERDDDLEALDIERESNHNWFLDQNWVAMALYADGFAGDLEGIQKHCSYLQELGINMLHIMPMMKCPDGASDGGHTRDSPAYHGASNGAHGGRYGGRRPPLYRLPLRRRDDRC